MAELEVVSLLLAWAATFGLLVVVPWVVVRVVVGVLEMDTETMVDRWTPAIIEPASEQPDESTAEAPAGDHPVESVHSDHVTRDQSTGRIPPRTGRER